MITILPTTRVLLHIPFTIDVRKLCVVSLTCSNLLICSSVELASQMNAVTCTFELKLENVSSSLTSQLSTESCDLSMKLESSLSILSCL